MVSCLSACARTSTPSTPTAASPTISATKSATPRSLWPFSTSGAANSTPATKAARAIPSSSPSLKPFVPARFPKEPFADLLTAFRQDQAVTRYATMQEVLGYCRYSANPVGRLVLYTCGYTDEERFRLSDATCSALQLANFWQDVRVDFAKDRVYIPQDDMRRFGVTDATIAAGNCHPGVPRAAANTKSNSRAASFSRACRSSTWSTAISPSISISSAAAVSKSSMPSSARIMMCCSARPAISKRTKLSLALRAVSGKFLPFLRLGAGSKGKAA